MEWWLVGGIATRTMATVITSMLARVHGCDQEQAYMHTYVRTYIACIFIIVLECLGTKRGGGGTDAKRLPYLYLPMPLSLSLAGIPACFMPIRMSSYLASSMKTAGINLPSEIARPQPVVLEIQYMMP